MFELNGFQRDVMYVLAALDEPSGREVKSRVESELDVEVTNGRLYPNLDELVERSLVEKGALDRRTNYYDLTPDGREMLRERQRWQRRMLAESAETREGWHPDSSTPRDSPIPPELGPDSPGPG